MELQYNGANCLKMTTIKKSVIIIDPKSDVANIKPDLKKAVAILATQSQYVGQIPEGVFLVDGPGEYEFSDYSIKGIATQAHTAPFGDKSATIYRVIAASDTKVLFVGHVDSKLSDEQLESIGLIDILVIPVGGNGYTLDAIGAVAIVRAIEPKLVIPVHYNADGIKYEVPQQDLELFIKELGAPVADPVEKYKVKQLPDQLTIQPLLV